MVLHYIPDDAIVFEVSEWELAQFRQPYQWKNDMIWQVYQQLGTCWTKQLTCLSLLFQSLPKKSAVHCECSSWTIKAQKPGLRNEVPRDFPLVPHPTDGQFCPHNKITVNNAPEVHLCYKLCHRIEMWAEYSTWIFVPQLDIVLKFWSALWMIPYHDQMAFQQWLESIHFLKKHDVWHI